MNSQILKPTSPKQGAKPTNTHPKALGEDLSEATLRGL